MPGGIKESVSGLVMEKIIKEKKLFKSEDTDDEKMIEDKKEDEK
jgi:hypothetical protein